MVQQNEGFNISGWWQNRNGDRIYVRDSVIDGEEMNLITDKGIFPLSEIMNDYVQCLEDEVPQQELNKVQQSQQINENNVFEEMPYSGPLTLDTPLTDDVIKNGVNSKSVKVPDIEKSIEVRQNIIDTEIIKIDKVVKSEESFENTLIKKLIDNAIGLNIKLVVDWDNIPLHELKSICTLFNITSDQIADYVINNITPNETEVYTYFRNILNDDND